MSTSNIPAITNLSPEAKRQLLALLARDLLAGRGGSLSVEDATGEMFVYAVPPDARARAERAMRDATPERLEELRCRAETPDDSFSLEEALGLRDNQATQIR
jgi:hypothetical protein